MGNRRQLFVDKDAYRGVRSPYVLYSRDYYNQPTLPNQTDMLRFVFRFLFKIVQVRYNLQTAGIYQSRAQRTCLQYPRYGVVCNAHQPINQPGNPVATYNTYR